MTTLQTIRLISPIHSGEVVLCQFDTFARNWREVLAEALATIHPSWAALSYLQSQLQVWEGDKWDWYL